MRNKIVFATAFIFALMVLALANNNPAITGFATEVISTAGAELKENIDATMQTLSLDKSANSLGEGAEICLVVETNRTTYYYKLTKTGDSALAEEKYCADQGQDNLIIKFNSYDDLLLAKSKPRRFIIEQQNTGYYIFPSNYVLQGGEINCNQDFQQKYCEALYRYLSSSEMKRIGLGCCASFAPTTPAGLAYAYGNAFVRDGWVYVASLFVIIIALVVLSTYRRKRK